MKGKSKRHRQNESIMPSCNVYLLDLTKTKENLFWQILAASVLYSDLVVEIGFGNCFYEPLPENVQMAKFSPNQFLL